MQAKLILRTISGEVYEFDFDLIKTVSEFIHAACDKYKLFAKTRFIFQTACINNSLKKK